MKHLILIALALVASCAYPQYTAPIPVKIKAEVDVSLAGRVLCAPNGGRGSVATATRVGDAVVTARHVETACGDLLQAEWSSGPDYDVTVITHGDPGECRDAVPGEFLVFLGYPGTDKFGAVIRDRESLILEADVGITGLADQSIAAASNQPPYILRLRGLTAAQTRHVRPGYSGGPVVSAEDGRVVGITNASADSGETAFFTPISTICKMIRKEAPYE